MSALPAKLSLAPDLSGFGISVAVVALADTEEERDGALRNMWLSFEKVRSSGEDLRLTYEESKADFQDAPASDLVHLLNVTGDCERQYAASYGYFLKLSQKPRFQSLLSEGSTSIPFGTEDLSKFLKYWEDELLPLIRQIRLSCVVEAYRRAKSHGISDTDLDENFAFHFSSASLEEADSWQETALLLADPKNAMRLLRPEIESTSSRQEEASGES